MKENKPRKNILARIFCKHDWHKVSDLYSYSSVEAMNAQLLEQVYSRWLCKKCGEIKKQKQL